MADHPKFGYVVDVRNLGPDGLEPGATLLEISYGREKAVCAFDRALSYRGKGSLVELAKVPVGETIDEDSDGNRTVLRTKTV